MTSDRDRLINELKKAKNRCLIKESGGCLTCTYRGQADCTLENIADYLLANGVIVPPVEVGQTVYVPIKGTSTIFETKVLAIGVDEDGDFVLNPYEYPDDVFCVNGVNIGKTVFLTKEEAEEKLKESKNNAT